MPAEVPQLRLAMHQTTLAAAQEQYFNMLVIGAQSEIATQILLAAQQQGNSKRMIDDNDVAVAVASTTSVSSDGRVECASLLLIALLYLWTELEST
jgi:hypothetical protein